MSLRRLSALCVVVAASAVSAAQQPMTDFKARERLTEAHYVQQGVIPLEQLSQRLVGEAAEADVVAALDGFVDACDKATQLWRQKGVALALDPAVASVTSEGVLEQARASLSQGDLAAAREAARRAYDTVLAIPYAALAEHYAAVAEGGGEAWAFNGWIELAGVRLKQRDMLGAEKALWQAYSATSALGTQDMDAIRKAFENLAERIGRGLINRNEFEAVREHLLKWQAAEELQKPEFVFAAMGLACFELGDIDCSADNLSKAVAMGTGQTGRDVLNRALRTLQEAATDPAAYAELFQLVETWRRVAPDDEEILKIPSIAARQNAAGLQEWVRTTTDCGIKAAGVQALQQAAPVEPYLEEAQGALACDPANVTAQTAVAAANYRLAVRAWNELAQNPPADSAAAAPKIEHLRGLLSQAAGNESAAELSQKVEDYAAKLGEHDRKDAAARRAASEQECTSLLERARWVQGQKRVALADLADAVEQTRDKSASCDKFLTEAAKAELEAIQPQLGERLQQECDAEYYRLPDLPSDPSSLRPDQLEALRPYFETYHEACQQFIANTFRAEKVEAVMKRLGGSDATP